MRGQSPGLETRGRTSRPAGADRRRGSDTKTLSAGSAAGDRQIVRVDPGAAGGVRRIAVHDQQDSHQTSADLEQLVTVARGAAAEILAERPGHGESSSAGERASAAACVSPAARRRCSGSELADRARQRAERREWSRARTACAAADAPGRSAGTRSGPDDRASAARPRPARTRADGQPAGRCRPTRHPRRTGRAGTGGAPHRHPDARADVVEGTGQMPLRWR